MSYQVTVAPSFEPLSIAEVRAHTRLCCNDDDTYVLHLISTARELAESDIGSPLGAQTRDYTFQCFPCALILAPNLLTVESITYIDPDGVTQTLDPTAYQVDTVSQPGKVMHVADTPWPAIAVQTLNPITVTVTAGFASAALVPKGIKHAMLLMIGSWYENREADSFGKQLYPIPLGVKRLLGMYRVFE